MKNSEPWAAGEAQQRCRIYALRLEESVLRRGRDLLIIWDSSNAPTNPLRQIAGADGKAIAINLMMSACLHEVIMIICAALDERRGRRALKSSNLVSFPVVAELMREAGESTSDLDAKQIDVSREGRQRFLQGVADLSAPPYADRLERLRAFRDDYLAHALEQPSLRTLPMLEDIHYLMDKACALSGDCQLALFGKRVSWREGLVTVQESINAVWQVIARAAA